MPTGRRKCWRLAPACSTATIPRLARGAKRWKRPASRIATARHVFDAFTSPGALTETIGCFVAAYSASDRVGPGGGVDADEHIEVVEVGYEQAEAMIASGAIRDAKTIALIYYAKATGLFG